MSPSLSPHPSDQSLQAYGLGKLDGASALPVERHLEKCWECRRRVGELSGDSFLYRLRGASAAAPPASPGAALTSVADLPPELASHPDYEVVRELGRGGMGVVYLAQNRLMGRLEVLKVVGGHLVEKPHVLERFLREIRSAAKLQHPNIVTAYSALRAGPSVVLAMEYVEGEDLARVVKRMGPLPVVNACHFTYQAALGLQHAHERGMVHRDIKPANLMLVRDGKKAVVKILDFGLAKLTSEAPVDGGLTQAGQMLGTPDYVAPEQTLDAQKADIRADIYSLGCTLYYFLAGTPPFQGAASLFELLQAHHSVEARPLNLVRPEVPAELAAVVARMMAKDPARRFQTPGEAAQALVPFFRHAARGSAAPAEAAPPLPPVPEPQRAAVPASPPSAGAQPAAGAGAGILLEGLRVEPPGESLAPHLHRKQPRWLASAAAGGVLVLGTAIALAAGVFRTGQGGGMAAVERIPGGADVRPASHTASANPEPAPASVSAPTRSDKKSSTTSPLPSLDSESAARPAVTPGYVALFNGRDLTGWKTYPGEPGSWRVENGVLVGSGPASGYLFSERGDFRNVQIRAEARINEGGNGGLFLRASYEPGVPQGYEVNINNTENALHRTGTLYIKGRGAVRPVRRVATQPDDWFTLEVIAAENHIVINVNGQAVASFTDPQGGPASGHIALQCLGQRTVTEFRKIEVKPFDADHGWSAAELAGTARESRPEPPPTPRREVDRQGGGTLAKSVSPAPARPADFRRIAPAEGVTKLTLQGGDLPRGPFWPTLLPNDVSAWQVGDPERATITGKGIVLKAGPAGNCLLTQRGDYATCTMRLEVAASRGTEAYLAFRARSGPQSWRAVTARLHDDGGQIVVDPPASDFEALSGGKDPRTFAPDAFFTLKFDRDAKDHNLLFVNGRPTVAPPGASSGVPAAAPEGAVGLFVKSGSLLIRSLVVHEK